MICKKCGAEFEDNFEFCPMCGASVNDNNEKEVFTEKSATEKENNQTNNTDQPIVKSSNETSNSNTESDSKAAPFDANVLAGLLKNKKVLIGIAIAVILLLIIGTSGNSKPSSTSTDYSSETESSEELSEDEIKSIVAINLVTELSEKKSSEGWSSSIDVDSCTYDIATIYPDGDDYEVKGSGYLYNAYGDLTSKKLGDQDYEFYFTIKMTADGVVKSCTIS